MSRYRRWLSHPLLQILALCLLSLPLLFQLTGSRRSLDPIDFLVSGGERQIHAPQGYMTGLHLTRFSETGAINYQFEAARSTRQDATGLGILIEPRLFFQDSPQPWRVDSSFGKISGEDQQVDLWDNVLIHRLNGSLDIRTSAMTLYPRRDYAETDRAVRIHSPDSLTEAVGMQAYMDEQRLVLLSDIRSRHEPKP